MLRKDFPGLQHKWDVKEMGAFRRLVTARIGDSRLVLKRMFLRIVALVSLVYHAGVEYQLHLLIPQAHESFFRLRYPTEIGTILHLKSLHNASLTQHSDHLE